MDCYVAAEEPAEKSFPSFATGLRFGKELTEQQKNSLLSLIMRRWGCFPGGNGQIGLTNTAGHVIDNGDAQLVRPVVLPMK